MTHPLDGTYQVTTTTDYKGPLQKKSDGVTEIRGGRTARIDAAGCKWTSAFTVLGEAEVEMVSVADPSQADPDFALLRPDGSPTREPVTYRSVLKLSCKGEKIQMSGRIDYSNDILFLTMRRVGD